MAIGGAAALLVVASAIGLTIWGVSRNKNSNPDNGGQNNGKQSDQEKIAQKNLEIIHNNGKQSDQEKIAQKNLEIIHKKFDDFYGKNKVASEKAKKIFDSVKSQMNDRSKWEIMGELEKMSETLIFNYFVDVLSGKIALDEKSAKNVSVIKAVSRDDFAILISDDRNNCIRFGYDGKVEKCFHT